MSSKAALGLALLLGLAIGAGYLIGTRVLDGSGGGGALTSGDGSCQSGGSLMATVNGRPIDQRDIDVELSVQKSLQGLAGLVMPDDPATVQAFRRELLDQVVDQFVIQSAAEAAGYRVTPEEAMAELPSLLSRYNASVDLLRQGVAADGLSEAELTGWAQRQVINGRYLQQVAPYSSPEDQAARLADQTQLSFCVAGQAVEPARVGQLAPDFELARPEGGSLRLSELRGKAVMVNFWATWCGPCKVEMPLYVNAYEQNRDDLVVVAVNVEETAAQVLPYVQQNGLSFPVVLDERGEVSLLYRVRGLPTTYFVGADGRIVEKHRGAILNRPQLQPYLDQILPGARQGGRLGPAIGARLGLQRWLAPLPGSPPGRSGVVDRSVGAG